MTLDPAAPKVYAAQELLATPTLLFRRELDVVVHCSDWHVGKYVDEELCGTGFLYNVDLYRLYLRQLVESDLWGYVRMLRQSYDLRGLYWFDTGDLLDNPTMRPGAPYRTDLSIDEQEEVAARTQAEALRAAKKLGFQWIVRRHAPGNHGRRLEQLNMLLPKDNLERGVVRELAAWLSDDPAIMVKVPTREVFHERMPDSPFVYRGAHGHQRRGGGAAWRRNIEGYCHDLDRLEKRDYGLTYVDLVGHGHMVAQAPRNDRDLIMFGGSGDGGDDYTCNQLQSARGPEQTLWAHHKQAGPILVQPVLLGGVRPAAALCSSVT